jgi:hypothetical protein
VSFSSVSLAIFRVQIRVAKSVSLFVRSAPVRRVAKNVSFFVRPSPGPKSTKSSRFSLHRSEILKSIRSDLRRVAKNVSFFVRSPPSEGGRVQLRVLIESGEIDRQKSSGRRPCLLIGVFRTTGTEACRYAIPIGKKVSAATTRRALSIFRSPATPRPTTETRTAT